MRILITAQETLDSVSIDNFRLFCKIVGINEWAINEGMEEEEEFSLTEEQAKQIRLI